MEYIDRLRLQVERLSQEVRRLESERDIALVRVNRLEHEISTLEGISEDTNHTLLRAIPDRIIRLRTDGTYLSLEGQLLTEQSQATDTQPLSSSATQQQLQYAQQALETGEVQEYVRQVVGEDTLCYEEVRIVRYDSNSVLMMVREVAQARQSEIALVDSHARYRELYRKTPTMLHSIDIQGRLVDVSDYWLQKLGYTRSEVIGRKSTEFLTADSQRYAKEVVLPEYFRTGSCSDVPYQMVTKTGEIIDVLLSAEAEKTDDGQIKRSLAVMADVTERNRVTAALEESELRFQKFMDNSPNIIFVKDPYTGRLIYINKTFENFFQVESADLLGKTDFDWMPLEVAQQNQRHDQMVVNAGKVLELQESVPTVEGTPQDWMVFKFPFEDTAQRTLIGGIAVNITEHKQLEKRLYAEKELAQVTLHSIGDAVITTDAKGDITYLNPVAEELTGWTQAETQGLRLSAVFVILNECTRKPVESPVDMVLKEGRIVGLANHTILIAKDGTERGIEDSAAPIYDRDRNLIGTVLVFHDVTEARQLAHQLTWQANHDELTHLVNRRRFEQELIATLDAGQETGALCYIDLDQFKLVNDTCGHHAGDALLQQVADILLAQIRGTDTVARLGGDEFAILLRRCSLELARRIANLVCQSIQKFRFVWEEKTFSIGASIGVVETLPNGRSGEVLAAADAACYAAKESGRNRVHVYRSDDTGLSQQRNQQQWCFRIDQALEENRFRLYHQIIAPIEDTEPTYHRTEILLRLLDEEGKIVGPMAFIPAAERYCRMPAIDQWMIRQFLREVSLSSGSSQVLYNLNLSGASLSDEQFLVQLKADLLASAIAPTLLCFETTETTAISNLGRVTTFMKELKQLGCQVALDDFGSGMSSFGYLRQLPVDYIKIDGSFITNLSDPINAAIVASICNISQAMNLQVIAEWVEDDLTRHQLKQLGVNYVQGFGIAQVVPFSHQLIDAQFS
ncbi:MAG: EAL domain-containing protein [Cyanobacteria bacterium P01_D01_bin.1]